MSNLQVECRTRRDALNELRAEWQALHQAADAAPFLSWEWMATWQRWLNPHGTPVLLCAREAGRLLGLLALNQETSRVVGLSVQRLSFLGDGFGGADYLDVLSWPGREAEVTAALFDFLTQQLSFDALELEGLDEHSHSLSWLAQTTTQRFQYRPNPLYVCPQVDLTAGWESVLKKSRRADNFKRRLRQLRARDGFAFRTVTAPAEAVAAFDRFLQLHEARWAEAGGSEMTGHAQLQSFHRDLVRRWADVGLLRFDELWVEGECRASIYGLEHNGRYYFYNSGYDQEWRNASVGLVALGLSIQAAIERGVKVYDFLRGTESYKFDWAGTTRATLFARLAPQRPRASLFFHWQQTATTLRKSMRDTIPPSLLFPLQQARRAWVRKQELRGSVAALPHTHE
jgi:CelD/BcsL family acetyltransferase involved in cellulose biosynthesis